MTAAKATRRTTAWWARLAAAVLIATGLLGATGVDAVEGSARPERSVKNPCRLVTRAEIATVLTGTTVGPGRRAGRLCRYEFATPSELAGDLALTTSLLRNGWEGLVDEAVRIDEQLGLTTAPVPDLGRRAVYEVEKSNLIVVSERGNIVEVQVLGGLDPTPETSLQQAVALARLALTRA